MVGPLTICLGLGLAVTYNNGVLEPKIWLSHHRDRVTFWLQGLNTHIRESIKH